MQKIFILEDDENINDIISCAINSQGLKSQSFLSPNDFWLALKTEIPSLLVLDIMLPNESGLSVLKKLKLVYPNIAVILLTANSSEIDKINGLELGADDYITKPFSVLELISRIKAVLRRTSTQKLNLYAYDIIMDLSSHKVIAHDDIIELTYKEFELLKFLIENTGTVLSRDEILKKVWNYDFKGESRTVDMHIKTLRQKLGASGEHIKTIRSMGYIL